MISKYIMSGENRISDTKWLKQNDFTSRYEIKKEWSTFYRKFGSGGITEYLMTHMITHDSTGCNPYWITMRKNRSQRRIRQPQASNATSPCELTSSLIRDNH